MVNYLEVSAEWSTGGSPTLADLQAAQAAGVAVVINLALADSPGILPAEGARVAELQMEYIHIPVVWEKPTPENLRDFFAALERCRGRKLFIHCVKNMRVSVFLYLYRVLRQGAEPHAAYLDMAQIWQPEGVWAAFIEQELNRAGG